MHSLLKKYLTHNFPFTEQALTRISECFVPLTVKKNTILLDAGDTCRHLYFINQGCTRTWYLSQQGDEKTRFIAMEGAIITSLASFISQQPSFEFVGTLEDCELLSINYERFNKLLNEVAEWREFYNKLLELAYIHQNKRLEQIATLTPAARYNLLMTEHPEYIKRLSNKVLATYLDVKPETLSRLKSR